MICYKVAAGEILIWRNALTEKIGEWHKYDAVLTRFKEYSDSASIDAYCTRISVLQFLSWSHPLSGLFTVCKHTCPFQWLRTSSCLLLSESLHGAMSTN